MGSDVMYEAHRMYIDKKLTDESIIVDRHKQVPRGYIRCEYFIGTHSSLISSLLLLLLVI